MQLARTEILISASPEMVYATLTDFERWPLWNPGVRRIKGDSVQGARLRIRLSTSPSRSTEVSATITRLDPAFGIEWRGGAPGMPWLLDIHHAFRIEAAPEGQTRFVHEERFSGLLGPLVWRVMEARLMPRYHATNAGLRTYCEAAGRAD